MASRGEQWSAEELQLLRSSRSFEEFQRRGGTRSSSACATRRYKDRQEDIPIPEWPRGGSVSWGKRSEVESPTVVEYESSEPEPFGFRDRDEDEDVRDYWEAQKKAIAAHQRRLEKRSNRVIPYTTDDPDQPFGIFFFGDTHIGSNGILADRMEHEFDLMRQACETLGARLVFMGDAIENAKIHGKAAPAVYDQGIPPASQREVADMLFSPLAPYFLAFLEGNHDARDAHQGGIGWMAEFAKRIGVPYVSEAGCAIHLTHGFQRYTIFTKHDWRGKSQINKTNSLRRFWQEYPDWENADVGVLAHLHEPISEEVQMRGRPVHWLRTGSLKVHDSYAERNGYTPQPGTGCVIFWPDRRFISVTLDLEEGIGRLEDARRRFNLKQEAA